MDETRKLTDKEIRAELEAEAAQVADHGIEFPEDATEADKTTIYAIALLQGIESQGQNLIDLGRQLKKAARPARYIVEQRQRKADLSAADVEWLNGWLQRIGALLEPYTGLKPGIEALIDEVHTVKETLTVKQE